MAANQTKEQVVSLKLLVNKETNKVLFAEAGKDFVDVLCSFLTLPLGTIARLLQKPSNMEPHLPTVGCLNSLYQTVADLDKKCFLTKTSKEMLLQPKNSSEDYCNSLKLNIDDTPRAKYFLCSKLDGSCCHASLYTSSNKKCVRGNPLTSSFFMKHFRYGFVRRRATFVITDDLTVLPISMNITSFGLLQNYGITNTSSVQEMTVNVTKAQVVDLLKCSLISKSPLTNLFLGRKLSPQRSLISKCNVENCNNIQIRVKLVIRKSDGKVMYAQGDQDFADLLLSFLTFPLGGVVSKLKGSCSLGSIGRLYKSIVDLDENKYFKSSEAKNRLVDPHVAPEFKSSKKILPIQKDTRKYFCYYHGRSFKDSILNNQFFISDEVRSDESNCRKMLLVDNLNSFKGSHEGYVKGLKTYVATDDLVVVQSSPILSLNLINRLKISLDDLKEKVVTIGINECLGILMAAMTSTSALTNGLAHLLTEVKEEK